MQLTQNGIIRIYKDQANSVYNPKSPLLAIPISVIDDVKKINMKNVNLKTDVPIDKKEKVAQLNKNQFMLLYTEDAIKL
jgi:hypothetical protein